MCPPQFQDHYGAFPGMPMTANSFPNGGVPPIPLILSSLPPPTLLFPSLCNVESQRGRDRKALLRDVEDS